MSICRRCLPFSTNFYAFSHSVTVLSSLDLFCHEARWRNGCDSSELTAALAIRSAASFPRLSLCLSTHCRRSRTLCAVRLSAAASILCTMCCPDLFDGFIIACSADLLSLTMDMIWPLRGTYILAPRYLLCNYLDRLVDPDEFGCVD